MRRLLIVALAATLAAPAAAVGLGPLVKSGVTDGPDKAFYLTLYNPYDHRTLFDVHAVGEADEVAQDRVRVPARAIPLQARSSRRFMVVAGRLIPGETYTFRVCAEKSDQQESIHARVCSRLTARRVAGSNGGA